MSSTPVTIHYSGGLKWRDEDGEQERVVGFAACCSGYKASAIRRDKRQTKDVAKVTCLRCLQMWRKVQELNVGRTG